MDIAVILGATIMLVGVASGFGFSFLAGELRDRKNARKETVVNQVNTTSTHVSQAIDSKAKRIIESLTTMRNVIANHSSKPIPIAVGDDLEGLIDEVLTDVKNLQTVV